MMKFYPDKSDSVLSVSSHSVYSWSKEGKATKHTGGPASVGFSSVAFSKKGTSFIGASDGKLYRC